MSVACLHTQASLFALRKEVPLDNAFVLIERQNSKAPCGALFMSRLKPRPTMILGLQLGMASEHFTYFAGQRFGRERLLQKCQAGFENPVVDDGVIGIA